MTVIKSFQDLEVWQRAHQLVLDVYHLTQYFPIDERHGLVAEMRRVAVDVPANIAEGFRRREKDEKVYSYSSSEAAAERLKYYLILIRDLEYESDVDVLMADTETVSRMLSGLVRSIKERE